jgi:hypothetical protein
MVPTRPSASGEKRVSIYDHIRAHIPDDGPGLLPGGERLPDEPEPDPDEGVTVAWAPGLIDEILEQGTAVTNEQAAAATLRLIQDVIRHPTTGDPYGALIEDLTGKGNLGFLDPLVNRVYHDRFRRDEIRDLALSLATRSSDRTAVKVGIALLGLCATIEDRDCLLALGRHEEFTHFVGVALTNAFEDVEPLLWELAKVVQWWGRINLVRQLASTRSPEIKAWILRQGAEDIVASRDVAYIAATTGELAAALCADEIDQVLYGTAGTILVNLIEARIYEAKEDIDDYAEGPEVIRRYLAHAARKEAMLESFAPLALIVDYLELRDGEEERRSVPGWLEHWRSRRPLPQGWTKEDRERSATYARWILHRPAWRALIEDGLLSEDGRTFELSERAARWLGDDTFPVVLKRIRRNVGDDSGWFQATTLARDIDRWNEVLEVGIERLRRHDTPERPMFAHWMFMVTQELRRFPGTGWQLFRAALQSPLVIERRFGLRGLWWFLEDEWRWPDDADDVLDFLASVDPDQDTRGWATELLELGQSPGRVTTP